MPTIEDFLKSPDTQGGSSFQNQTPQQPSPDSSGGTTVADFLSGKSNSSPENLGQFAHDESDRFTQEDPNANWAEKTWSFLNKPLTETLFGWGEYRQGAGGIERGIEKTLSGLTSPLSLGLMAAFAPAGIGESVAGSALKEGLTEGGTILGDDALDGIQAAKKVEDYTKAVQAAKKAQVAGQSIQDAVSSSSGMPYQEFLNYGNYLRNRGLDESDMLAEGFARRSVSQGLRKAGVTPDKAVQIAKGAEALVNAGFAATQLHGALYAFPRFLDLMSHGDYNDAGEYLVEGGLGSVFGFLGGAHAIHSLSDLAPAVNETAHLPLADETEAYKKIKGAYQGDLAKANTDISNTHRDLQVKMFEAADLPVPARFKVGNWSEIPVTQEISSAWNDIISSDKDRQKLADLQKKVFLMMDNGGDRVLSHQQLNALLWGYKLEDWGKQNLPGYETPIRSLEDVAKENQNNILYAKNLASENRVNIENTDAKLLSLRTQLSTAKPEEQAGIQAGIKQLEQEREDLNLKQANLDNEYDKAKQWQTPSEETYLRLYKEMNNAMMKAVDSSKSWDEFLTKVRALGNYPQDMKLILDKYPQFRNPEYIPKAIYRDQGGAFYLKAPNIIQSKIQGSQSGPQVLQMLKNNGVKPDELFWTGLDTLLGQDKKFTKQELLDHIQNNRLKIIEVPYGEPMEKSPYPKVSFEEWKKAAAEGKPVYYTIKEDPFGPLVPMVEEGKPNDEGLDDYNTSELDYYIGDPNEVGRHQYTRFSGYTYPGGENQRELVISIPKVGTEAGVKPTSNDLAEAVREYARRERAAKGDLFAEDHEMRNWMDDPLAYLSVVEPSKLNEILDERGHTNWAYDRWNGFHVRTKNIYESSHWPDVANPVAHARANDRVTSDGKRLFNIEELQSDLHQQGRDEGYTEPIDPVMNQDLRKKMGDLERKIRFTQNELHNLPNGEFWETVSQIGKSLKQEAPHLGEEEIDDLAYHAINDLSVHPERRSLEKLPPEARKIAEQYELNNDKYLEKYDELVSLRGQHDELKNKLEELNRSKVPNAPFKKSWPDLLAKRMIHFAAERGYDGISWIPGEVHSKRWGTERFDWKKNGDRWDVKGTEQYGGQAAGINLEEEAERQGMLAKGASAIHSERDLHELVSRVVPRAKENKVNALTKKLWTRMQSEEQGTLMPRKEGLENFYNKDLRDIMNSIGKRFGAKVETVRINDEKLTPEEEEIVRKTSDLTNARVELESRRDRVKDDFWKTKALAEAIDSPSLNEKMGKLEEQFHALSKQLTASEIEEREFSVNNATTLRKYRKIQQQEPLEVHYLPLNNELKHSVLTEGFPLFNRIKKLGPDEGQLAKLVDKLEDAKGKFQYSIRTGEDVQKTHKALMWALKQVDQYKNQPSGEVHKLPDGTKVAYLSPKLIQIVNNLGFGIEAGDETSKLGGVMLPNSSVQDLLKSLDKSDYEYKNEFKDLINHALNDNGSMVVLASETDGLKLHQKLAVLREELIHNWQLGLSKYWSGHLTPEQTSRMVAAIPEALSKYLEKEGYEFQQPLHKVIEATAHVMAGKPSELGLTAEEAKNFLVQYFQAIKEKHGEQALETLTHTTNEARHIKEDFLKNGIKLSDRPTDEGTVASVGEGGGERTPPGSGGAGAGGGGEPPEPPDWEQFAEGKFGQGLTSAFPIEPWQDGPQHPALPVDLSEKVNKSRARNFSPDQTEYVKGIARHLADIAAGNVSPQEMEIFKALKNHEENNWTAGYNNGIIKSIVDNHIHHIWGEPDDVVGNPVRQMAGSGAFSINASQARHRTWGTAFEGFLQGKQLKVHDPVALWSHDANNIARAAAARKTLLSLQSSGMKDPEGMPLVVFYGRGYEVPGADGTKSSILVNPNVVRNILMEPHEVQRLTDSGLLDTYLKDGRVVDHTPQVTLENVGDWIRNSQKKLEKLQEQNPLLYTAEGRKQAEAGWGQLKLFAQQQAKKIADYLDEAIEKIKDKGPVDGTNYSGLPLSQKPNDIQMAKYLDSVLHSGKKISPGELKRLEEYADRNRAYANGESTRGEAGIRPHEVARLALQEKDALTKSDPEVANYVTDVMKKLGYNWDKKGINRAAYYIAHAAENELYPQLIKDLADLKYVDNTYTSVNPLTQQEHKADAIARLEAINSRQPKEYLWAPKTHIVPDHPAFHGWKWMATAPDGTPTLAESDMGVSRYYYKDLVNSLGLEPSWLRKNPVTGALLSAGGKAKNILLSGSPFHIIQEALRALMLHVNPFVRPNPLADIDEKFQTQRGKLPIYRIGVNNGLTLFTNRFDAEDYSVGVASHIADENSIARKVPIVNQYIKVSDQIHDLLFNRLIPSYKASGFRKMFDKYAQLHPDWSNDAVAKAAAEHTNAAFGGINWRAMGRAATTQDWFHLFALAPDWLESELRFMGSLMKGVGLGTQKYAGEETGKIPRQQVAEAAIVLWTTARVLNSLYSGNPHYEAPFGLATKDKDGKETIWSVRTLPTDTLHLATDPWGFIVGRESPTFRSALEVYTGRNQYGQKLSDAQKYVDIASNLLPIWGQSTIKQATNLATGSDVGFGAQVAKASGVTARVYRTPAELTAADLASQRSEEGSMNPALIAKHRLLLKMEDDMRAGRLDSASLEKLVDTGQLAEDDAKQIIKISKETKNLDPELARMYSRVSRLDAAGAFQVYKDASPSEKALLHDLVVKKAKSYIKKSLTGETPHTRLNDPIYKLARQFVPLDSE